MNNELHALFSVMAGFTMLATVGYAAQPGQFSLVHKGKPQAVIVTAEEPTSVATFAAAELQYHLQQITGTILPIVTEGARPTGPRILVGKSRETEAILPQLQPFKTQEYLIRFLPDALILLGTETPDTEALSRLPNRTAGRFGRALQFDGRHRQYTLLNSGFNDDEGTMEAWVWLSVAKPKTHATILRLDSGTPWTYHILQRDMNSSRVSYTTYDGKQGHGIVSAELAEGWHHVLGTHDARAGKMELFVDGVRAGSSSYVKTVCKDVPLGIGGMVAEPRAVVGNPFEGLIDEVRISKVVRQVKGAAGGPYEPDEQTTLLLHCDEHGSTPRNSVLGLSLAAVPPPALFGENGTLYAVYDFLERCCDVRSYCARATWAGLPENADASCTRHGFSEGSGYASPLDHAQPSSSARSAADRAGTGLAALEAADADWRAELLGLPFLLRLLRPLSQDAP